MPRSPSPRRRPSSSARGLRMDNYSSPKGASRTKARKDVSSYKVMKKARSETGSQSNYWTKRLLDAEERDPTRWRHSGFKELYRSELNRNQRHSKSRSRSRSHNRDVQRPPVRRSRSRSRNRDQLSSRRGKNSVLESPSKRGRSYERDRVNHRHSRSSSGSSLTCSTCRSVSSSSSVSVRLKSQSPIKKVVKEKTAVVRNTKAKALPERDMRSKLNDKVAAKSSVKGRAGISNRGIKVSTKAVDRSIASHREPASRDNQPYSVLHSSNRSPLLHEHLSANHSELQRTVNRDSVGHRREKVHKKRRKKRRSDERHPSQLTPSVSQAKSRQNGSEHNPSNAQSQQCISISDSDSDSSKDSSSDSEDYQPRMSLSERFSKLAQLSADRREFDHVKLRIVKDTNSADMKVIMEEDDNASTKLQHGSRGNDRQPPPGHENYSYFTKRGMLGREAPRNGPLPHNWDDVRVRYNYYRDRGYFYDRDVSFDEYVKWEEWWYKYQEWLETERYYDEVARHCEREREWAARLQQHSFRGSRNNYELSDLRTRRLRTREHDGTRKRRKF